VAIFLLITLALTLVAIVIAKRIGVESADRWASYAQSVATVVGVVAAAYLFLVERRDKPHADVSQDLRVIPLDQSSVAIEAAISVKNLGNQLITLNHLNTRLQATNLASAGLQDLPRTAGVGYWKATGTIEGKSDLAFDETELRWPQIRIYDGKIDHEIEPGETDVIVATFIVPCFVVSKTPQVRVATDVRKAETNGKAIAWKARTFTDIGSACSKARK
jgi:hypothetical protein